MAYNLSDGLSIYAPPVSREMMGHHTGHVSMANHTLPPVHTVQMDSAIQLSHAMQTDQQSPLNYGLPPNLESLQNQGISNNQGMPPNQGIPSNQGIPNQGIPSMSVSQPNHTVSTSLSGSTSTTSEAKSTKAQPQILEKMKLLRDSGKYCDVLIDVKGTVFRAHKNILAAWSPYFDVQLCGGDGSEEKDMLVVNYDNCEVFSDLLDFLYSGCIAPRETNFLQLLHLAVSFQIDLLRSYCEEFLRCNLHLGNFVSTYFLARKYRLDSLEEYIVQFLQMNLSDTVKQSEFLSLPASRFNAFLSSGWMEQIKPEITLFLIISWVGCDVRERERYLVLLLGHIDWSTVASDFLLEISRTENFFTTHESSLYLLLQTLYSQGISLGPYTELFPSLRQTYSHLLSDLVHTGMMLSDLDTYCPVTVTGIMRKEDATVNTEVTGPDVEAAMLPEKAKRQVVTREVDLGDNFGNSSIDSANIDALIASENNNQNQKEEAKDMFTKTKVVEQNLTPGKVRGRPKKIKFIMPVPPEKNDGTLVQNEDTESAKKQQRTSAAAVKKRVTRSNKLEEETNQNAYSEEVDDFQEFGYDANELDYDDPNDEDWKNDEMADEYLEGKDEGEGQNDEMEEQEEEEEEEEEQTEEGSKGKTKKGKKGGRPRVKKELKECPYCDFSSNSVQRFTNHMKRNHQQNINYVCNICQYETKWNKQYYKHMKTHIDGPPFHCDMPDCSYVNDRLQVLLIHRLKHGNERPFGCDQCDQRFRTRNNLHAHIKLHSGLRPFSCPECDKSFATKNTMEQHLVTHSDHRPYLCDECGFSTKYQSHLISHKRTHTGDVFPCNYPKCTYTTPKRSQLKAHMRSHLGIRNFQCQTCGKAFIEKSHLVRHERTHLAVKPFKCQQCDYATTRGDKLKDHVEKHHGEHKEQQQKHKRRRQMKDHKKVWLDTDYVPPHPTMVNLDHGGYTMQHPQTDTATATILQDIRTHLHVSSNLDQFTVTTVPIMSSRGELTVPTLDDKTIMMETSGQHIISSPGTPINVNAAGQMVGTPESDHQGYIQSTANNQNHVSIAERIPQAGQNQDYGGLSAFMALF